MKVCIPLVEYRTHEVLRGTVEDAVGLKALYESIDNRADFKIYMQNYAYAHGGASRGPRREGPAEEGFVSFPVVRSCISMCVDRILKSFPLYPRTTQAMPLRSRHPPVRSMETHK